MQPGARMRIRASSDQEKTAGQALVELALVVPVLFVLLAAAVDLGRVFYSQITVTNAAREGALEAALHPTSFSAGQPCDRVTNRVMCRAVSEARQSVVTVTPADVSMTCSATCTAALGNTVTVRVAGHFTLLTPLMAAFMGGSDITLASSATAQLATAPSGGVASTPSPSPTPTSTPTPTPTPTGSAEASASPSPSASPTPVCIAPTAAFTVSPTSGFRYKNAAKPGTTFRFTNLSTNMVPGCEPIWSWNFGDGSGASSLQDPTYLYVTANTTPGFTVSLTASNAAGSSTATVILRVDNP